MSDKPNNRGPNEPETTGHVWDGLEEYNNPLPRWWLWTFYATIIWGIGYTIAYPAWPLLTTSTAGVLGYSTRAEVAADLQAFREANAANDAALVSADLTAIAADPAMLQYANSAGAAVFRTFCAQCHGSGAAGALGYPNLLDNDWLWGGDIEAIHTTVTHGIRNTDDPDARFSEMPAFAEVLTAEEIGQVAEYTLALSGQEHDAALASAGSQLFLDNCSSCHGEQGEGMRDLGAPALNDAIWLYGGTGEAIASQIAAPKNGVMPAWNTRLSEAEIRAVAVYVHGLGGGETLQ